MGVPMRVRLPLAGWVGDVGNWWHWEGKERGPDNFDLLNILSQLTHITILKGNTSILILYSERGRQREGRKSTN